MANEGQAGFEDRVPPRPSNIHGHMPRPWTEDEIRGVVADQFRNEYAHAKAQAKDATAEGRWKRVALYGGVGVGAAVAGGFVGAALSRRKARRAAMKPAVTVNTK